jgi:hypothetical protein
VVEKAGGEAMDARVLCREVVDHFVGIGEVTVDGQHDSKDRGDQCEQRAGRAIAGTRLGKARLERKGSDPASTGAALEAAIAQFRNLGMDYGVGRAEAEAEGWPHRHARPDRLGAAPPSGGAGRADAPILWGGAPSQCLAGAGGHA